MLANNLYYPDQQTQDNFSNAAAEGWNIGGWSGLGLLGIQIGAGWAGGKLTGSAERIANKYGFQLGAKTLAEREAVLKDAAEKLTNASLKKTIMVEGRRAFSLAKGGAFLSKASALADVAFLAPMLFGMTYNGFKGIQRLGYELERPEWGGRLTLSTMAFTDRQRSFQKMAMSEFNGRTQLGNEAGILHR